MIINKVFKTKEKMYAYYLDQAKQKVIKRRKDLIASYSIVLYFVVFILLACNCPGNPLLFCILFGSLIVIHIVFVRFFLPLIKINRKILAKKVGGIIFDDYEEKMNAAAWEKIKQRWAELKQSKPENDAEADDSDFDQFLVERMFTEKLLD